MRSLCQSRDGSGLDSMGAAERSLPSAPAIAWRTVAQSRHERHMGPSLSMVHLKAMALVRETRPTLGRRPVMPKRVDGDEIEPSVSEPMAKPTQPAETAL